MPLPSCFLQTHFNTIFTLCIHLPSGPFPQVFSPKGTVLFFSPLHMPRALYIAFFVIWSLVAMCLDSSKMNCDIFNDEVLFQCCKKVFQGRSTSCLAAEVLLQPWIWTVCIECGPDGLIFVPHFVNIVQYCVTYCYVGTGKSRYGICVNFYRPMERVPPGGCLGGARGDRHSSTFRRESWRKSIEKSSDSAFSRLVTHPVQRLAGLCFPLNYKYCTVIVVRQLVKKNSVHYAIC